VKRKRKAWRQRTLNGIAKAGVSALICGSFIYIDAHNEECVYQSMFMANNGLQQRMFSAYGYGVTGEA